MAKPGEKGKRGERELRDVLIAAGYEARRGGQQGAGGSAENPDVIHSIPGIHIECKRVEAFSCLTRAMVQAARDAGPDLTPVVFSRSNRAGWLVTFREKDFFALMAQDILSYLDKGAP